MSNSSLKFEPLTVPSWPSCKDCLSWCAEHLAIAGGEAVHILTSKPDDKASQSARGSTWHLESIRVNLFEETEWPYQELAPIHDFSIGEEQSESTVISSSWSYSGLGRHRRSVLAVLTSNLLLSIWESDGNPGSWRRVSIINTAIEEEESSEKTAYNLRRRKRIRAFVWLPPVFYPSISKWGRHHLLVADDCGNLIVISFVTIGKGTDKSWILSVVAQWGTSTIAPKPESLGHQSPFLQAIQQSSSVTRIDCGKWEIDEHTEHIRYSTLKLSRSPLSEALFCRLKVLLSKSETSANNDDIDFDLERASTQQSSQRSEQHRPAQTMFSSAIVRPISDYSNRYGLRGKCRIRYWGTTFSVDRRLVAACVTLHPADMIEYTTPATERCIVVFSSNATAEEPVHSEEVLSSPRERILQYVAKHASEGNVRSDLDKKLVQVAAAFIQINFSEHIHLLEWSKNIQNLREPEILSQAESTASMQRSDEQGTLLFPSGATQNEFSGASNAESCEICNSSIHFTRKTSTAQCSRGHYFTRCNLSLMAIQEPGVSKYCSECGMQFLDLAKLESLDGPSLTQDLFEDFDVCPYCQGKFRG